jgi:hypothetical protein
MVDLTYHLSPTPVAHDMLAATLLARADEVNRLTALHSAVHKSEAAR